MEYAAYFPVRECVIVPAIYGLAERGKGIVLAIQAAQSAAQVVPRSFMGGINPERSFKGLTGISKTLGGEINPAQIV